jgi:GNAT superfamily N-acetyltransferase
MGLTARSDAVEEWLEDGWSTSTPLDDTLLHQCVLALAAATADPAMAMGARHRRDDDVVMTDLGRPAGYWNAATVLRPLGAQGWADLLERIQRFVADGDQPRRFDLWSPFPTPDLRAAGWNLSGHVPLMWRPPGFAEQAEVPGLTLTPVRSVDDLRVWARVATRSFPLDGDPSAIGSTPLLGLPGEHLVVASIDGEPVGAAAGLITHRTNVVQLVGVDAEARGRGIGGALTSAVGSLRPDLPAALLASDDGRPVYERLGYLPLVRWPMWIRTVT